METSAKRKVLQETEKDTSGGFGWSFSYEAGLFSAYEPIKEFGPHPTLKPSPKTKHIRAKTSYFRFNLRGLCIIMSV